MPSSMQGCSVVCVARAQADQPGGAFISPTARITQDKTQVCEARPFDLETNKRADMYQARIQDSEGGFRTFRRGGGGVRTGISGADPNCCRALGKLTSKQKLQTAVGGGGVRSPKKKPCIRARVCTVLFQMMRDFCHINAILIW